MATNTLLIEKTKPLIKPIVRGYKVTANNSSSLIEMVHEDLRKGDQSGAQFPGRILRPVDGGIKGG